MPNYPFICVKCRRKIDVTQGIHDPFVPTCCGVLMKKDFGELNFLPVHVSNDSIDTMVTGKPFRYNYRKQLVKHGRKHGVRIEF